LWAIGITFISGAELALLFDTLRELGREKDYPLYRGKLQAMVLGSIAVSSILGGVIGEFNLAATFILTAAVMVVATLFVILLKEPPREVDKDSNQKLTYRMTLMTTIEVIRKNKGLRYALLFSSTLPLLGGIIQVTFMQPYVISIGLPIVTLGIIALGLRISQIIGALNTQRILNRFGEWRWLQFSPLLAVLGVIALGVFNSVMGIIFFALTGFVTAVTGPLMERKILELTPGSIRATILSMDSLLYRFLLAIVGPLIGMVADHSSLPTAFWSVGFAFGIFLLVILLLWGQVRKNKSNDSV
jgi:hypothetical protein